MLVAVDTGVLVAVGAAVLVAVGVGVFVAVGTGVLVAVGTGVKVAVGTGVGVSQNAVPEAIVPSGYRTATSIRLNVPVNESLNSTRT